ncbi:MAG: PhoU domain-containing protein [Promethearchaeota archaeon]
MPKKPVVRKVQFTGKSTFVVSLPKGWTERIGIQKGDSVSLAEEDDGSINIFPIGRRNIEYKANLKLSEQEQIDIERWVLSAYLAGADHIILKSKTQMDRETRKAVNNAVGRLTGLEIVEENTKKIICQSLIETTRMKIETSLRRAFLVVPQMLEDAIKVLRGEDDKIEDVKKCEETLDRFCFLMTRQLHVAQRHPKLLREMGMKRTEILDYFPLVRSLERIGDRCLLITELCDIYNRKALNIPEEVLESISHSGKRISNLLRTGREAFFKLDLISGNHVVEQARSMRNGLFEIDIKLREFEVEVALLLSAVIDSIIRMTAYVSDLGEIIIDRAVSKTLGLVEEEK